MLLQHCYISLRRLIAGAKFTLFDNEIIVCQKSHATVFKRIVLGRSWQSSSLKCSAGKVLHHIHNFKRNKTFKKMLQKAEHACAHSK